MSGYKKVFIDESDFYSFTVGTNVNLIALKSFDYMQSHTGIVSGLQTLTLQGNTWTEVAFASIDTSGGYESYAISGTTNTITLAVNKTLVDTADKARKYIIGMVLVYQMYDMEYVSTDPTYTMTSYAADGTILGTTRNTNVTSLITKMEALDDELNVNDPPGYYMHVYTRGMMKSV